VYRNRRDEHKCHRAIDRVIDKIRQIQWYLAKYSHGELESLLVWTTMFPESSKAADVCSSYSSITIIVKPEVSGFCMQLHGKCAAAGTC
jgi:hypothetical protein